MGAVKLRLVVRATLVVVVVVVIASTFSGSGSWDAHLTPQEAVIAAGGRTVEVGSARVLRTERQTDSTGKQVSASTSEGVVDFKRKLVRYDRFMPKGAGGFLTVVLAGDMFYGRLPFAMPALTQKGWIKQSLSKVTKRLHLSGIPDILADPVRGLDQLHEVVNVTRLGRENVHGVDTRHYKGTITVQQASSTVTIEVWIDGEGHVRRTRDTFNLSKLVVDLAALESLGAAVTGSTLPNQATGEVWSVSTTEYYDFGAPVDVQVPSDSDTFDFDLGRPD